MSPEVVLKKRA